jgi:hypothetical protein
MHAFQDCSCPFIPTQSARGDHFPLFKVEDNLNGLGLSVTSLEAGYMSLVLVYILTKSDSVTYVRIEANLP